MGDHSFHTAQFYTIKSIPNNYPKENILFSSEVKGGYLDFSHLTELKIYITEIHM